MSREEGGPREGETLFTADGATHGDHVAVDGIRQPLEPRACLGIARVGVGPHVQLSMRGVGEEHRRHIVLFEHRLQPPQEVWHGLGRNHHVFHEGHRTNGAADSVQRGHHASGKLPENGLLGGILGPADVDAQRSRPLQTPRGFLEARGGGLFVVAREFDEQPGVGDRWNQLIEDRSGTAGQGEVPLVEQVARIGRERSQPQRRLGRPVERVEQEQPHGRGIVGRHGAQRGLGDDPQRAVGAAEQPRQIDEAVAVEGAEQIVELVAAVRAAGDWLGRRDQRPRRCEDRGHGGGKSP